SSLVTNEATLALRLVCAAFLIGKSGESVVPVTYIPPEESTAMALASLTPLPPRYVAYSRWRAIGEAGLVTTLNRLIAINHEYILNELLSIVHPEVRRALLSLQTRCQQAGCPIDINKCSRLFVERKTLRHAGAALCGHMKFFCAERGRVADTRRVKGCKH